MIKKSKFDELYIGLIIGLLVPLLTVFIVFVFLGGNSSFFEYIKEYNQRHILTKLVSICAIPNLGLFYFFINKEWYKSGKGVIASVFLMIFWVLFTSFF
jgi:hypothetical protein